MWPFSDPARDRRKHRELLAEAVRLVERFGVPGSHLDIFNFESVDPEFRAALPPLFEILAWHVKNTPVAKIGDGEYLAELAEHLHALRIICSGSVPRDARQRFRTGAFDGLVESLGEQLAERSYERYPHLFESTAQSLHTALAWFQNGPAPKSTKHSQAQAATMLAVAQDALAKAKASLPSRRCGACEQQNPHDARFCRACGEKLEDDAESPKASFVAQALASDAVGVATEVPTASQVSTRPASDAAPAMAARAFSDPFMARVRARAADWESGGGAAASVSVERAPEQNHHETLQVSPNADPEVIEAAYKRLALKWHPDQDGSEAALARMKAINVAYAVLRDPDRRAAYDAQRGRPPRQVTAVRERRRRKQRAEPRGVPQPPMRAPTDPARSVAQALPNGGSSAAARFWTRVAVFLWAAIVAIAFRVCSTSSGTVPEPTAHEATRPREPPPVAAESLAESPHLAIVTNTQGEGVRLRDRASFDAKTATALPEGTEVLVTKGACAVGPSAGASMCPVASRDQSVRGWVPGRYLVFR